MAQFDLQITLEYGLVEGVEPGILVEMVNKWIDEGWQPLGGAFSHEGDFYQTMVREKKPEVPKVGDKALCQICGKEIIFLGQWWDHPGELKPRHPAWPKEAK